MKNLILLSTFVITLVVATTAVADAQVGYGGNSSGSSARVEVCHKGQTIKVARSAVAAHMKHGDTRGVCGALPQVLGASTFAFNNNMNLGSAHSDVKKLQEQLRKEGHFTFPTDTGFYGPLTQAAVKKYQAAHPTIGFVTGYTGPLTRAELNR